MELSKNVVFKTELRETKAGQGYTYAYFFLHILRPSSHDWWEPTSIENLKIGPNLSMWWSTDFHPILQ